MQILLTIFLFLLGCQSQQGPPRADLSSKIIVGKTTSEEMLKTYGPPARSYRPASRHQAEVHQFAENEAFQSEGGKVVAYFRDPITDENKDERSLQYWRHLWRGQDLVFEELPGSAGLHGDTLFVLKDQVTRIAVVYDTGKKEVVRVLRYEN